MPRNNAREYRVMPVMVARAAEGEDPSLYRVEGYATTFEEPYVLYRDYDGNDISEVIDKDAFVGCDMEDVIFQFDHAGRVYARTSNGTMTLETDEHGLKVTADLSTTSNARNMYEDIQAGLITQMSFAFTIADDKYDKETKTYRVKKIGKLYDVSAVSIPANPGTDISAARKRSLDGVIREQLAERRAEKVRQVKIDMLRRRLQGD